MTHRAVLALPDRLDYSTGRYRAPGRPRTNATRPCAGARCSEGVLEAQVAVPGGRTGRTRGQTATLRGPWPGRGIRVGFLAAAAGRGDFQLAWRGPSRRSAAVAHRNETTARPVDPRRPRRRRTPTARPRPGRRTGPCWSWPARPAPGAPPRWPPSRGGTPNTACRSSRSRRGARRSARSPGSPDGPEGPWVTDGADAQVLRSLICAARRPGRGGRDTRGRPGRRRGAGRGHRRPATCWRSSLPPQGPRTACCSSSAGHYRDVHRGVPRAGCHRPPERVRPRTRSVRHRGERTRGCATSPNAGRAVRAGPARHPRRGPPDPGSTAVTPPGGHGSGPGVHVSP